MSRDPLALPALAVLVVFVVWAWRGAGYSVTTWYPGAVFLVALALVTLLALRPRPTTGALIAVGWLLAFAAWTYASIAWAGDRGIAWDGANRTALYLVVFTLFAVAPWRSSTAVAFIGAYSLAIAAVAAATVIHISTDPASGSFIYGRLSAPAGYPNASAALFLMAVWPALHLASRRRTPVFLRGLFLAAAGVMVETALLAQSRGSLVAVPLAALVYFAVVPGRLRSLLALAVLAVVVAAAAPSLLHVYTAVSTGGDPAGALGAARKAIASSAMALFAAGAAIALADARVVVSPRVRRGIAWVVAAAAVVAATAGAVVLAFSSPVARAEKTWRDFKAGSASPVAQGGSSHLGKGIASGNNRYDFWRVAVKEFRRRPLVGVGVDNFAADYVRERRSPEEPLYSHSLELRVLSGTGIVGALLILGFAAACVRTSFRPPKQTLLAGPLAAALVGATYWVIHGSVDWFWEFPGLGAPAFAWLGLVVGLRAPSAAPARRRLGSVRPISQVAYGGLVVCTVALAVSFVLPWLAAKNVAVAAADWRHDRQDAYDRLERARRLNPLSTQADLVEGAIASRTNDLSRMQRSYGRALDRQPSNWYAHLELGLARLALDDRGRAIRELRIARSLDPREPVIHTVLARVLSHRPVSRDAIDRVFLARLESVAGSASPRADGKPR